MASLTIRNLDEATKQSLRERAAHNGRSMEEEMRHILASLEGTSKDGTSKDGNVPLQAALAASAPVFDQSHFPQLRDKRILLIITGGIAAYKALDLIRRLRDCGAQVRPIMTKGAQEFITPLSVGALCADHVYLDLFSREDEQDVGHIRLARDCDLVLVAPATANIMAKMASGLADDLASTVLLASDRPIVMAPAMNPKMWDHPATQRNFQQLKDDGIAFVGPEVGEMAESGEAGRGRLADVPSIIAQAADMLDDGPKPLRGKQILVTSGPTHEPIDPVRYIANRSSGKQGHAIAHALAQKGAEVFLISGPVTIAPPHNVQLIKVQTAQEMLDCCVQLLPVDAAVMVAAVADWRVAEQAGEKIKKQPGEAIPPLHLTENPDILKTIGHHDNRPNLVVGFAAETQNLIENATGKLKRKGADLIVANDVSAETGVMGGDRNRVKIVSQDGVDAWPDMDKQAVAKGLATLIAKQLRAQTGEI